MRGAAAALCRVLSPQRLFRSFVLLCAVSAMSCPEGESLLSAYHFSPLVPPSNMFVPATVLAVEEDGDGDIQTSKYKIVCGPRASLGPGFIAISSHTVGQNFRESKNTKWQLDLGMTDRLKGIAKSSRIESISAKIVNAKILSLSDADVLENLKNRSPECKRAIQARLSQGFSLTMVAASLVADMQYEVRWKDEKKVDSRSRLREMQEVAAQLGGGASKIGLKTIDSKGLALGVRTDAFLLALSDPELDESRSELQQQAQMEREKPARRVSVDPTAPPDSPYVLPVGGTYIHPELVDE